MSWLYVLRCRAVRDTNNCDKCPVVGLQDLFTIATWSTSVVNLFFASRIFARNSTRCMTSERLRLVKEWNWTVCEWTSADAGNFVISLIRHGCDESQLHVWMSRLCSYQSSNLAIITWFRFGLFEATSGAWNVDGDEFCLRCALLCLHSCTHTEHVSFSLFTS